MMRGPARFSLLLSILGCTHPAEAVATPHMRIVDSCVAKVVPENRHRTHMKNRAPGDTRHATPVTVDAMLSWPLPTQTDDATRRQDTAIDSREQHAFVLDGWVRLIKIAPDDCDVHAEISAGPTGSGPRVIVEVPQGTDYDATRAALLSAAGHHGELSHPVHVRVTGWAFWDSAHWTANDPQRGHGHGSDKVATLWELHPTTHVVLAP